MMTEHKDEQSQIPDAVRHSDLHCMEYGSSDMTRPVTGIVPSPSATAFEGSFPLAKELVDSSPLATGIGVAKEGSAESHLCPDCHFLRLTRPHDDAIERSALNDRRVTIRAQAHLAAIVSSSDDAIMSQDLNRIILSWNDGAERLTGYTAEEVVGRDTSMVVPLDRLEEEGAILARVCLGEHIKHFETVRLRKDGSSVEVSTTVSPIRGPDGTVIGASRVARDISDRVRAEEAQAHLAAIIESSDDAIISLDLDGIVRTWNPGAKKLYGYSAVEVVGHPMSVMMPPDRIGEAEMILEAFRRGDHINHLVTKRLTKEGQVRDVFITISPVHNARGQLIGASKIARDATSFADARREREEWTAELERQVIDRTKELKESVNDMEGFAHSASHDLQSPLRAIEVYRLLVVEELGLACTERVEGLLAKQGVAVGRMNLLIKELLNAAHNSRAEVLSRDFDLSALIWGIWNEITLDTPTSAVKLRVKDGMRAWGDPVLIRFVYQNLLQNAIKYSPNGGLVRVDELEDGTLTVQDEGVGFDMAHAGHLFEPFQRLVSYSEFPGTGIGLSNAKRIVERHHGRIWVDSRPSEGATFFIRLPGPDDDPNCNGAITLA